MGPSRRPLQAVALLVLAACCLAAAPVARGASCTSRCDSCKVKDTGYQNGVSSSDCRKCARGYKFWPCNTSEAKRHCECVKDTADDDDNDDAETAAAEASTTAPASPSAVSAASAASPATAAATTTTTMDTAELVQDLKANIGVAPAAETQEAASGGAHRCSKCPGECVAAPGATQRHGITDAACAKCAKGYKWWPCQESGQCRCADASSVLEEDEEEAPAPTAMVASLPMSLDLVAALDCPTGAARSAAGDCQCPEGQVLSADSSACQEATTEASPDVTYAAAGNWNACGGISFCGDDKACAPCASANYECVSLDGNAWYWQCRQIPGTVDLTCGANQEPNAEGTACVCLAAGATANAATGGCDCPTGQALDAAGTACAIQSAEETNQVEASETSQANATIANATLPAEIDLPCTQDVRQIITKKDWEDLFPYRNDPACKSSKKPDGTPIEGGFYEYEAFVEAAELFPCFLGQGNQKTREREAAAFLAQISHETTGGWATAPGGAQSWGLCWKEEVGCEQGQCAQYCAAGDPCTAAGENLPCVCASGKTYHGRGPMQLSWNYNYAPASEAMRSLDPRWADLDLLENPNRITEDPVLAFATGIHFWQNPRGDKPSAHDVMTSQWQPSDQDIRAGRVPGFGVTTNIINGGLECNIPNDYRVEDRVKYFERYSGIFGVSPGDESTLRCDTQISYG